jgi:hypothetical protein
MSILFTGTPGNVCRLDTASAFPSAASIWSVSLWIYVNSFIHAPSDVDQMVYFLQDNTSSVRHFFDFSTGTGSTVTVFSQTRSGDTDSFFPTNNKIEWEGQWRHFCFVQSALNSRAFYRDGSVQATGSVAISTSPFTTIRLGGATGGTANLNNTNLAEFAIYNKALTAAEITSLSKGIAPPQIATSNLLTFH